MKRHRMPPLTWLARHGEELLLIAAMGVVSGLAQFVIHVRSGKEKYSVLALVGEIVVSGSASSICGLMLLEHAPLGLVLALSGVAGHMGTRFIYALDNTLTDMIKRRIGPGA